MSWFAELAGRAEHLLNNLDEQTGAAIRNHNVKKPKPDIGDHTHQDVNRGQKLRGQIVRQSKKTPVLSVTDTRSSLSPVRKIVLTPSRPIYNNGTDSPTHLERHGANTRKSPTRFKTPQFHLNKCPKTMVGEFHGDSELELRNRRQRRYSLPPDIEVINSDINGAFQMENVDVENAMLKNELNYVYKEVSELLDKLKIAEESKEFGQTHFKLEDYELLNHKASLDNASLSSQLNLLKSKIHEVSYLEQNYQDDKQRLIKTNNDLEERVKDLTKRTEEQDSAQHKLETELRHAQSAIIELQSNLEKANGECHRLESDWETYKLRVKSMLFTKDNQIKALQDGMDHADAKVLVEQLDSLKQERDELSEAVGVVRKECDAMKLYLGQVESRHMAAEKVVAALRDALKDERAARNKVEAQCFVLTKELKMEQIESGQTIASLRTALRDKESELNLLREAASSVQTPDASALNVADYAVTRDDSIENEKIHYLTESLVQRQGKVDRLMAENNMFRIQLDKLESKLKSQMSNRSKDAHSVVNVQREPRARRPESCVNVMSHRIAAVIRRHPVLRIFVILYMICLHFWVLTILFTSTQAVNLTQRTSIS